MPKTATTFLCLFLSFILIITLVLPKKEAWDFSQKKIKEKKMEIQNQEEYFLNLKRLSEELKNYQNQLSKIDSALPEDPEIPLLFNFLQKSAVQSGLVLSSIKFSTSPVRATLEKKPELQETKIDLTVSGSYPALKNFLSTLEKSARLIEVENLTFFSPKEETFKFDLKIKVYSY